MKACPSAAVAAALSDSGETIEAIDIRFASAIVSWSKCRLSQSEARDMAIAILIQSSIAIDVWAPITGTGAVLAGVLGTFAEQLSRTAPGLIAGLYRSKSIRIGQLYAELRVVANGVRFGTEAPLDVQRITRDRPTLAQPTAQTDVRQEGDEIDAQLVQLLIERCEMAIMELKPPSPVNEGP